MGAEGAEGSPPPAVRCSAPAPAREASYPAAARPPGTGRRGPAPVARGGVGGTGAHARAARRGGPGAGGAGTVQAPNAKSDPRGWGHRFH
jgi:hypothetical protein